MTIDAETLKITSVWVASGHSFANRITASSDGSKFLAVDLGDNAPRAINLHRFDESGPGQSRAVYNFKTKHATKPQNEAGRTYPVYKDISTAEQTFYKHSNDNSVYTEIAQVVETEDGPLIIFFAGERAALDNSQVPHIIRLLSSHRQLGRSWCVD